MPDADFQELIRRVRQGDEAAAEQLVRQYEAEIRRVVRVRLTNPQIGRIIDSVDVCQSVLANFFQRASAGQFEIETPEQLIKLLAQMAKNRLIDVVRRVNADKRGNGRTLPDDDGLDGVPIHDATPSQVVMREELAERALACLSAEERELVAARNSGREWADIARMRGLGETPEALRKRFDRALKRVAEEMGASDLGPL